MNDWGRHREVEKPKPPTQLERHVTLRAEARELLALLGRRDEAIIATLGRDNPIRQDLSKVAKLINRLVDELREPKAGAA